MQKVNEQILCRHTYELIKKNNYQWNAFIYHSSEEMPHTCLKKLVPLKKDLGMGIFYKRGQY